MRMLVAAVGAALALVFAAPQGSPSGSGDLDSGADRLGRPAPEWSFDRWVGGRSLSLRELRGKVVLLRWWTENCHFCASTLPVLERVRERDAGKGLVVIGVYHPKPPRPVSDRHVLG